MALFDKEIIPLDHTLTLTRALQFNAEHNPDLPFWVFSDPDANNEVTTVSHSTFYDAARRAAQVLFPAHQGNSPRSGEVVGVLALSDAVVYQAVTAGCVIAGVVPFLIFPRISPEGILGLLKASNCHRLVVTQSTLEGLLDSLVKLDPDWKIETSEMPMLQDIFPTLAGSQSSDSSPDLPSIIPAQEPSSDDVLFYLHSSGSTGLPKAIPIPCKAIQTWMDGPVLHHMENASPRQVLSVVVLPNGHFMTWLAVLMFPIYTHLTAVVFPPVVKQKGMLPVAPNPANVLEYTKRGGANSLLTVPALLHAWVENAEAIEYLAQLDPLYYGGGPISPDVGEKLVQHNVKVQSVYGTTEVGPLSGRPNPGYSGWQYISLSDKAKIHWEPQGDGTFELQIINSPGHYTAIQNADNPSRYTTSDLWEKHPTVDVWRIVGRLDDVIIHSSGEKTVPAPMETIITSSTLISAAIMFGREHDQAGLLVEPHNSALDFSDPRILEEFRNQIWPVVERANAKAPTFSRIFKEMILVAPRPLPRASKGTVQRKAALKAYQDEIEALYESVAKASKDETLVPPTTWTPEAVEDWLFHHGWELTSGKLSSRADDLFQQGFDSLNATILRRRIAAALKSSADEKIKAAAQQLSQNVVYDHPSVSSLAQFITGLTGGTITATSAVDDIEAMITEYSQGLPASVTGSKTSLPSSHVALITGTTGALGSYLLRDLLSRADVTKVYAFNRSATSGQGLRERQTNAFASRGLDPKILSSPKLELVTGDLTAPNLGLDETVLHELASSVTIVIHNAWRLDFNLSLASFLPQVKGTRNLIDFALASQNASSLRFIFTSSVASASGWDRRLGPFPEEVQVDASVAVGNGYGQSKYVAERILSSSGLSSTSIRIGQLAGGDPAGAWSTTDWVPILTKSAVALGKLPSSFGHVSWLSLDQAAHSIVDVAFSSDPSTPALNLLHPRPTPWNTVMESIIASVNSHGVADRISLVPFPDWVRELKDISVNVSDDDLKHIPALKLLPFFESSANAEQLLQGTDYESGGLVPFALEKMLAKSAALRNTPRLEHRSVDLWIRFWKDQGLFA